MRELLKKRIVALRAKTDPHIRKFQPTHKPEYNRSIRKIPPFTPRAYVILDSPIFRTVPGASTETIAEHKQTYNELQPRTRGPYQIMSAQENTVTIEDNRSP